jgi:hypothetical protein
MITIHKYVLDPGNMVVEMRQGATILCVREQREQICIWAEVDDRALFVRRRFEVFGTGHEIKYGMGVDRKYLGTAFLENGNLVFHVYERIN